MLAALALCPGIRPLSVWRARCGATAPTSASKVLQGCLVRLRKALGAAAIETTSHGYLPDVPPDDVDAQRFERLVGAGGSC